MKILYISKNEVRNQEADSLSHLAGKRVEMKVSFYSVYFPAGCLYTFAELQDY